jgi:hypothetical protein
MRLILAHKREEDNLWTAGQKALSQATPASAPDLTAPKLDLYVALPIIRRDRYTNFEIEQSRLEWIEKHRGLTPSLLSVLSCRRAEEERLIYFPYIVIESKHHRISKTKLEFSYSQTTTAATASLALLNTLTLGFLPTPLL